MAILDIKTVVTGPDVIDVKLVRSDVFWVTGLFRTLFEVFLSITSAMVGILFTARSATAIHWLLLGFSAALMGLFLILAVIVQRRHCG
jgi:hypothetical protein